eukprot:5902653-Prymnesium_polylepis.2
MGGDAHARGGGRPECRRHGRSRWRGGRHRTTAARAALPAAAAVLVVDGAVRLQPPRGGRSRSEPARVSPSIGPRLPPRRLASSVSSLFAFARARPSTIAMRWSRRSAHSSAIRPCATTA